MKQISLFAAVVSAAMAIVPMNSRATVSVTAPATDQVQSSNQTVYYFYNVDADAFLTLGGSYGTHAVVADLQKTDAFQFVTAGSANSSNSWIHMLKNASGADLYCPSTTDGNIYTDRSTNGRWKFTISDDNDYYTISNTASAFSSYFMGLGSTSNSLLMSNCASTDDGVEWKLVIADNIDLFVAKMNLYKLIVIADGKSLTDAVTAAETAYSATSATVTTLNTAAMTLKKAICASATTESPVEITAFGKNMSFSKASAGWQDLPAGWSQTTITASNGNYRTLAAGSINVYENWRAKGYTGTVSQTVSDLPAGKYKLTLKAFTNNTSSIVAYEQQDDYKESAIASTSSTTPSDITITDTLSFDGQAMTFGLNSKAISSSEWMGFGDVQLYYLGYDATSSINKLNLLYSTVPTGNMNTTVKTTLEEKATAAKTIIDAATGTYDNIAAAYDALMSAIADANTSISEYTALKTLINEATTYKESTNYSGANTYATAISTAQGVYDAQTADATGLTEAETTLNAATFAYNVTGASASNVVDVTSYITNPNFASSTADGWTATKNSVTMNAAETEIEFYEANAGGTFSFTQDLSSLPEGYYRLNMQGFQRVNNEITNYNSAAETIPSQLFVSLMTDASTVNSTKYTSLKSIFTENPTGTYASNMATARAAFNTTGTPYDNDIVFYKSSSDNIVRIGVRQTTSGTALNWTIFKNFRLYYYGNATGTTTLSGDVATAYTPAAATGSITLDRTLKTTWSTLCVPFDVPASDIETVFGTDTKVANLVNVTTSGNSYALVFSTKNPVVRANVPCLIKMGTEAKPNVIANSIIFDGGADTTTIGNVSMIGNYDAISNLYDVDNTRSIFFINGGNFYLANSTSTVAQKPFRAYISAATISVSAANEMDIDIDGNTTTGMTENAVSDEANGDGNIYNMNGQIVRTKAEGTEGLMKGVYIMNRKALIIK